MEGIESTSWQLAHYKEPYATRRKNKLPAKLARFGFGSSVTRDSNILDACCGRGDALELLQTLGYTNLKGADGTPQASWLNAPFQCFETDVRRMPFASDTFDYVLNLHALHHFANSEGVISFLTEVHRVLKPGGRLLIIDFPASLQIKLLFALLRRRVGAVTGELKNFADILDEEWEYLSSYLQDWPAVRTALNRGPFEVERREQDFFLYYLTLKKV